MLGRVNKTKFLVIFLLSLAACTQPNQGQTRQVPPQVSSSSAPASAASLPDFTSLVQREGPAVVNISTTQTIHEQMGYGPMFNLPKDDPFYQFFHRFFPPTVPGPQEYQGHSLGSGFIISGDGYILTNAHVVNDAEDITVKLTDKREFKAKVIGLDQRSDVALLKINATDLPKVEIGDSSKLKVGQWVVAIGSPFGFENSVTAGIVSAKGRELPDENYVPFIQTDVPINPGNSGGPLFNLQGQVVGINSQIWSRTGGYMGLSFAIPIDVAMEVGTQLREHGKVTRGRLGVGIQPLTAELAQSFGLSSPSGVLIASVEKGSAAERAGLQPGDVIQKYNGKTLGDPVDLSRVVAATHPGTRVQLQIWRKGTSRTLSAVIGEMPSETVAANGEQENPSANRLGLVLNNLNAEQKQELDVDHGLLVKDVSGLAAKAGIQPGDVILALNNNEVKDTAQFKKLLGEAGTDKTIALLVKRNDATIYIPIKIKEG
ncbi:MAG TPA: DegQ family serine endoprotease [Burkholderiales bacterium]|nr:DegQ family serine endoprotease [Burkholderiales bacterium]